MKCFCILYQGLIHCCLIELQPVSVFSRSEEVGGREGGSEGGGWGRQRI